MKHTPLLFLAPLLLFSQLLAAQTKTDSTTSLNLEEAVIYSNKFKETRKNIAQQIDVITARKIAQVNAQNTGDLLFSTGTLFVQKSQQGGSSPVIRGFEASRVLLVVDGIRMNNAIYRAGHLQNVITVDQNMLERVEVLYGPTSTLYGSDALGGVVHLRTKQPRVSNTGKTESATTTLTRISTANRERTIHLAKEIRGKKWSWLQALTYSNFGDMKMGSRYPPKYPDFGRRPQYIQRGNNADQIVNNVDDRVQRFSGYKQWDILQKFLFKPNEYNQHTLTIQHSNSSNIPRYDRLQDRKTFPVVGNTLRWAEWFYGPQTRWLSSYEWNNTKNRIADELRFIVSYQDVKESRQQREYLDYTRFDSRREHIKIAALNFDIREKWNNHELILGADGQFNFLRSVADRTNLLTGIVTPLDSRYPNGNNEMHLLGVYAQHLLKINKGKWVLNDGLRLQQTILRSTIKDNSFFNFPFVRIDQQTTSVTGNIGIIYNASSSLRLSSNIASGFRAPNIDDVARIFESSTVLQRLVVPNPAIKPEYTYNGDLQLQHKSQVLTIELTGFYTLFRNAIVMAPFTLNGQDSLLYNGIPAQVIANQNARRAFIRGFSFKSVLELNKRLNWESTSSFTYGRFKATDGSQKPLDHIPPVFGRTALLYNNGPWQGEFFLLFNGWKRKEDYNLDGEDNVQYATPDGTPAWYTLNLKTSYQLEKNLQLQVGLENILDRNYRYFASGFSAPGRNLFVAIRANF
ncbi:MAG: TonB-dependent receptor [Bacteroidetes bacterium]|nr:TonB-dependent receptor [Bacteroidota bacterium]